MHGTIIALFFVAFMLFSVSDSAAQPIDVTLTVSDKPTGKISPILHGLFFEDINFAGDGGLYPQRIKNGSFEFQPDPTRGWRKLERGETSGQFSIRKDNPLNENNPTHARLVVDEVGGGFGIVNEGFRGIGITKGEKFDFSIYVRTPRQPAPNLTIELHDNDGKTVASAELNGFATEWKKYECVIESPIADSRARLALVINEPGSLDIDMALLHPQDTFNGRKNGLRKDLVQLLKEMKPGFLRFPGGCIVEGRTLENRYQWKHTIGDLSQRKLIVNRWNTEFAHKDAPDYFQSFGLGFLEYFLLCEDIGAKPVPILNCGMACQYNTSELVPLDELQPYIQDALDLIEFANGPVTSTWGKVRAEMGHPQPFNLEMIGIGNEQWGERYFERYERFFKVLREKHPEIKIISSSGPQADGKDFDYGWKRIREIGADLVDEHYYRPPQWFLGNVHRYDNYDRNGPKVFAGEYASHVGNRRNDWEAALSEAAFMTGLERNGDVVHMAAYAPLFAHIDAWQWAPNLIWFDNLRSYGTPSYYVQKIFSTNRGETILPVTANGPADQLFSCASLGEDGKTLILKLVSVQPRDRKVTVHLPDSFNPRPAGSQIVLSSKDLNAVNSIDEPKRLVPVEKPLNGVKNKFQLLLPASSVSVLRINLG